MRTTDSSHGLTLVETLVSIAIVGILVALLIPAVQTARESARKTHCQSNLRQVALALHAFHAANGELPSHYNGDSLPHPLQEWDQFHTHAWRVALLPHLERVEVRDSVDWNSRATARTNEAIATTVVSPYLCPSGASPTASMGSVFQYEQVPSKRSREDDFRVVRSDYDGLAGIFNPFVARPPATRHNDTNFILWGVWGKGVFVDSEVGKGLIRDRAGKFGDALDGLSNTIMLAERGGRPLHMVDGSPNVTADNPEADYGGQVGWSASTSVDWRIHTTNYGVDHDNRGGIYSDHASGAYVALADGSVTFLSDSTEIAALARLIGRSDGQR